MKQSSHRSFHLFPQAGDAIAAYARNKNAVALCKSNSRGRREREKEGIFLFTRVRKINLTCPARETAPTRSISRACLLIIHTRREALTLSFTLRGRFSHKKRYAHTHTCTYSICIYTAMRNIYRVRRRGYLFLVAQRLIWNLYAAHGEAIAYHFFNGHYLYRKRGVLATVKLTRAAFTCAESNTLRKDPADLFSRQNFGHPAELKWERNWWTWESNWWRTKRLVYSPPGTPIVASRINS